MICEKLSFSIPFIPNQDYFIKDELMGTSHKINTKMDLK